MSSCVLAIILLVRALREAVFSAKNCLASTREDLTIACGHPAMAFGAVHTSNGALHATVGSARHFAAFGVVAVTVLVLARAGVEAASFTVGRGRIVVIGDAEDTVDVGDLWKHQYIAMSV
jgi:hypothetical protein